MLETLEKHPMLSIGNPEEWDWIPTPKVRCLVNSDRHVITPLLQGQPFQDNSVDCGIFAMVTLDALAKPSTTDVVNLSDTVNPQTISPIRFRILDIFRQYAKVFDAQDTPQMVEGNEMYVFLSASMPTY